MSEGKTPQRARIDEVLAAWPEPERSPLQWDEAVEGVMAKLESGSVSTGVSDEDLFAPPLPAADEEVQGSASIGKGEAGMTTSMTSRQRDRANMKELARMADMPPPSSQPTSGMFAEARRASQPPAEEREENSGLIQLAALAESEAKQAPASAPARAAVSPRSADKRGSRGLLMLGGMVAAAAVAAGVFVGMRGQAPEAATPVAVAAPPPGAPQSNPGVPAPIAQADKGIDPSTLPPADTAAAGPALSPGAARPPVAVAAATATATAAAQDPKLVAVIPAAAPPAASAGSDQALHQLMQQAAGVTPSTTSVTTPDAPLAASPGSVPFKPSMGAINGALGAALPGARACLGPDDPISRATVTFQSDGSVQGVSVSGGAAGKPAEGCIRAALLKARVQPFAVPTFSAPTTIRPN